MKPIKVWDSGMNRIFISVICPQCEEKVSVQGEVKDSKIELGICPKCNYANMVLSLGIDDPQIVDEVVVTIRWDIGNKEMVEHKMPFTDIVEAITYPIDLGCFIFSNDNVTPLENRSLVVHKLISDFGVEELEGFKGLLDDLIKQKGELCQK
jgi:hypothetical protein